MDFWLVYAFNLALAYDQCINAILLGDPDESISGRLGRAMQSGKPKWWVPTVAKFVDWLFLKLFNQQNHVLDSIEPEENPTARELWSWQK